jgi:ribosome-associated translation inhibitor RaiA
MHTDPEIHFHGIDKSEAIEERVREKVAKLERRFGRMSRCRVVLEAPHRSPQKPKVYQIKIEISLPRRKPIVVSHERAGSHAHEELALAIRDAFEAQGGRGIEQDRRPHQARARPPPAEAERGRRGIANPPIGAGGRSGAPRRSNRCSPPI